jgi:hypothetical protein
MGPIPAGSYWLYVKININSLIKCSQILNSLYRVGSKLPILDKG